jgi:GNAT superfamily N-acetyltransferase
VWFGEVPGAPTEVQLQGIPEEQRFAAETDDADPGTYPGIYGVFPLTLSVPGTPTAVRQVPCAGLTWVGVHPDHRRRGVLTAMLRHHFEQVHEQPGTHVSALHASEPAIYGRHGYGLASLEMEVTLGRGTTLTAPHLDEAAAGVSTRLGSVSDPDVPKRMRECHLAAAPLGAVVGELGYYTRVCTQLPEELRDKEPWRVLFARRDGVDVGFAMFRREHKWERARPAGEVKVWALVG